MMIKLLVILICLGLDYVIKVNSRYRPFHWFTAYEHTLLGWTGERIRHQPWIIVAALFLPFIITFAVLLWLSCLSRPFYILFSILVLWACLSTTEWRDIVLNYLQDTKEKDETEDLNELLTDGHALADSHKVQDIHFASRLKDAIFWQAHEQVLAIIFWFVVLGPIGAAAYRFIWLMCHRSASDIVTPATAALIEQLHELVAWISARVTAFTYCLVGNWHPSWGIWAKNALRPKFSRELLIDCGNAALDPHLHEDKHKIRAALSLVTRTLIAWLLLLLLVVILH